MLDSLLDGVPLHPALVHVPLGLGLVIPFLAGGFAIAIRRGGLPARAWVAVVALQAVVALSAFAAVKTGHGEARRIGRQIGDREAIETHEERAEAFAWTALGALVLAAAVLALPERDRLGDGLRAASVAVLLAAMVLAVLTGHAGGLLVHHHLLAAVQAAAPPP